MRRWQLVEITWCDSDHGTGWQITADLHAQKERTMLCKSVGYYFRDMGDSIQIAMSYSSENTANEQVNGPLTIPKVAIKKKRLLR